MSRSERELMRHEFNLVMSDKYGPHWDNYDGTDVWDEFIAPLIEAIEIARSHQGRIRTKDFILDKALTAIRTKLKGEK